MLFKATITADMLADENALSEQLYIFLKEYVPTRLKYESSQEREDCVQDSIMYLLKRYRQLDEETKENINLEKFFYNRAHSYLTGYINKLRSFRKSERKYKEQESYMLKIEQLEYHEPEFVDYEILDPIIQAYKLDEEKEKLLKEFSEERLKNLGYDIPDHEVKELDKDTHQLMLTLSFAVIDEYMINSTKEKANV